MRSRFTYRLSAGELTGALGDLGTFVPLALALMVVGGAPPFSVLAPAALLYIGAGAYFGLPIPVQPLKVATALAVARGLGAGPLSACGLIVGALFLLAGASGLAGWLAARFRKPLVRGIQIAVGIVLAQAGLRFLFGGAIPTGPAPLDGGWRIGLPDPADLWTGLWVLALPQIPVTFANAVVAASDTARLYFGDQARRVTPRALAISLGLANLGAGLVGGMPLCHGSGGLTAHYRMGARTATAPLLLGAALLVLAVTGGGEAREILSRVPVPALGALLLLVGVQHIALVRDLLGERRALALASGVGLLGAITGQILLAVVVGLVAERGMGLSAPTRGRARATAAMQRGEGE